MELAEIVRIISILIFGIGVFGLCYGIGFLRGYERQRKRRHNSQRPPQRTPRVQKEKRPNEKI